MSLSHGLTLSRWHYWQYEDRIYSWHPVKNMQMLGSYTKGQVIPILCDAVRAFHRFFLLNSFGWPKRRGWSGLSRCTAKPSFPRLAYKFSSSTLSFSGISPMLHVIYFIATWPPFSRTLPVHTPKENLRAEASSCQFLWYIHELVDVYE